MKFVGQLAMALNLAACYFHVKNGDILFLGINGVCFLFVLYSYGREYW